MQPGALLLKIKTDILTFHTIPNKKKIDTSHHRCIIYDRTILREDRHNILKINDLETVTIVGLGLLGGSLALAINRAYPHVKRVGFSHRSATRQRALRLGVVDCLCDSLDQAVRRARFIILATPIGAFEPLMKQMSPILSPATLVTDVGSTKVVPTRWAKQYLPKHVEYLGSHPVAGSEQRGVEFARADLFDNANCIITPTAANSRQARSFLLRFWNKLQMKTSSMTPTQHDRLMAAISHLPHLLATTLVNCSDASQLLFAGKGFLDTTRIASGPPAIWRDILMSNAKNTEAAINRFIRELTRLRAALNKQDAAAVTNCLKKAQTTRNNLVAKKLRRKELPA